MYVCMCVCVYRIYTGKIAAGLPTVAELLLDVGLTPT